MIKKLLYAFTTITFISISAMAQVELVSDFTFDNSLMDATGNGTMSLLYEDTFAYNNGILSFSPANTSVGAGLKVLIPDQLFDEQNYSIAIDFSLSQTSGYRKVVDYNSLTEDYGCYVNSNLVLYDAGSYGSTDIAADSMVSVLITRSSSLDSVWFFLINGTNYSLESSGEDVYQYFVAQLEGADRALYFFMDDSTTFTEFSNGVQVDRIRIWNGIVNGAELGIKTVNATEMVCFPNPVNENAEIRFSSPATGEMLVYATDGRLVFSQALVNASEIQIPMENLNAGVYVVQLGELTSQLIKR